MEFLFPLFGTNSSLGSVGSASIVLSVSAMLFRSMLPPPLARIGCIKKNVSSAVDEFLQVT